jgi:hypothetical protein
MTETETLHHGASGMWMSFNFENDAFSLCTWPPTASVTTSRFQVLTWQAALVECKRWLLVVRAEDAAPLVCASLAIDGDLAGAAAMIDDLSRLTQREVSALRIALSDLRSHLQDVASPSARTRIDHRIVILTAPQNQELRERLTG